MTPKERAAMQQALEALEEIEGLIARYIYSSGLCYAATAALREALEVTEASISDHKSEQVMVSVDFMRHLEARFSYYGELVDGEWGNGRDIEELDAAHLLPKEVYQIRKILKETPVFGFIMDKKLAKQCVCGEPESTGVVHRKDAPCYFEQAEQEPVAWRCVIPRRTWTMGVNWGREYFENEEDTHGLQGVEPLYAAPVRTKDLTDDEIAQLVEEKLDTWNSKNMMTDFARAVIAADREKNK